MAAGRLDMINLPMVEEPEAVAAAALLDRYDVQGRIRLLVNIETPKGVRRQRRWRRRTSGSPGCRSATPTC